MRIALDIETNLAHSKIWLCKTLDIDSGEVKTWNNPSLLRGYIADATLLVAHNGIGFDFRLLRTLWNTKTTSEICDTLVLSRLLDPSKEGGHSLEAWGRRLGTQKVPYKKIWEWMNDRSEAYPGECYDVPIEPLLGHYCEGDVLLLRELFLHLEKEAEAKGFSRESVELEHRVAEIISEQEQNGFKLDLPFATCLLTELKGRLSSLTGRAQELYPPVYTERFHKTTGKPLKPGVQTFNLGSRLQCIEKLKKLGWKPTKKTELGTEILDEAVLDEIIKEFERNSNG